MYINTFVTPSEKIIQATETRKHSTYVQAAGKRRQSPPYAYAKENEKNNDDDV